MFENDFHDFTTMFDGVMGLYPNAKPATVAQKVMFFRALSEYTAEQVAHGFDAHVKTEPAGRFPPVPADVIGHIKAALANDGRPGAEEAWAIAITGKDESATIVWTTEMSEAFGICKSVLDAGDEVGARMAFKEAYQRLVGIARANQWAPQWNASLGFDKEQQGRALAEAVKLGRISQSGFLELAPPSREPALLLQGPTFGGAPAHVREKLLALRDEFAARAEGMRNWTPTDTPTQTYFHAPSINTLPPGMKDPQ
jgi:hypothetical protein